MEPNTPSNSIHCCYSLLSLHSLRRLAIHVRVHIPKSAWIHFSSEVSRNNIKCFSENPDVPTTVFLPDTSPVILPNMWSSLSDIIYKRSSLPRKLIVLLTHSFSLTPGYVPASLCTWSYLPIPVYKVFFSLKSLQETHFSLLKAQFFYGAHKL